MNMNNTNKLIYTQFYNHKIICMTYQCRVFMVEDGFAEVYVDRDIELIFVMCSYFWFLIMQVFMKLN